MTAARIYGSALDYILARASRRTLRIEPTSLGFERRASMYFSLRDITRL